MKKNNIVLAALLTAVIIFGFIVTYRNQSSNTAANTKSVTSAQRASADKDAKRNSLLRQLDKNKSAMDRAKNEGQRQRLAKQAEKLQNKLNDLQ